MENKIWRVKHTIKYADGGLMETVRIFTSEFDAGEELSYYKADDLTKADMGAEYTYSKNNNVEVWRYSSQNYTRTIEIKEYATEL